MLNHIALLVSERHGATTCKCHNAVSYGYKACTITRELSARKCSSLGRPIPKCGFCFPLQRRFCPGNDPTRRGDTPGGGLALVSEAASRERQIFMRQAGRYRAICQMYAALSPGSPRGIILSQWVRDVVESSWPFYFGMAHRYPALAPMELGLLIPRRTFLSDVCGSVCHLFKVDPCAIHQVMTGGQTYFNIHQDLCTPISRSSAALALVLWSAGFPRPDNGIFKAEVQEMPTYDIGCPRSRRDLGLEYINISATTPASVSHTLVSHVLTAGSDWQVTDRKEGRPGQTREESEVVTLSDRRRPRRMASDWSTIQMRSPARRLDAVGCAGYRSSDDPVYEQLCGSDPRSVTSSSWIHFSQMRNGHDEVSALA
ncbi:hypothetical protein J6590_004796 [Homalodisca vitripennis]|nr:hypothetical protein J6590_004796 [Homalodisca vitripennis]